MLLFYFFLSLLNEYQQLHFCSQYLTHQVSIFMKNKANGRLLTIKKVNISRYFFKY